MPDPIRTEPVFDALKQPLAFIEGDERRRSIEAYIDAARLPAERAVFDLMAQLVREIDERVGERFRIRLAYHPDGLALEIEEKVPTSAGGEETQWATLEGDIEKITIRIPAELKDLATQAAQRAGTSANTWFVKAMARAVRNFEAQQQPPPPPPSGGHRGPHRGGRFTGWVGGEDDEVD